MKEIAAAVPPQTENLSLAWPTHVASDPPHFVGRGREVALIQALFHEATIGMGSALFFEGEPGIGKSRLLSECVRINPRAHVISVRCGMESILGNDAATHLARAMGVDPRNGRRPHAIAPLVHSALVERARRKTVVVLVDDIHQASEDEADIIESISHLSAGHRIALIGSFGEASSGSDLRKYNRIRQRLGGDECVKRLNPLDDAAIELLVRGLRNGSRPLTSDELREIVSTAQGNPRMAIELIDCALGSRKPMPLIPSSARAAVAALRADLLKAHFDVLAACSVVAPTFSDAWIADVLDKPRSAIADALQSAVDLGVLVEQPDSPGWFSFQRVAVRKALYFALISIKRRVLHERIARYLGAEPVSAAHAALVAHHWDVLSDHERAAEWLIRAAETLVEDGAHLSAAECYARAANHLAPQSDRWISVQRTLAVCYRRLGEWTRVIPILRSILETPNVKADAALAEAIFSDLLLAYLNDGDRERAESLAKDIAALGYDDLYEAAMLLIALHLCYAGKREDAARIAASLDARTLRSGESRIRHLVACAEIGALHEPLERSLELIDRATEIARGIGITGTVYCCDEGVELALRYGDVKKAAEYLERSAAFARLLPSRVSINTRSVSQDAVQLHVIAGDLRKARDAFDALLSWHDGGAHNEAFVTGMGLIIAMRTGDPALVDALFDPALLSAAIARRDAESAGVLMPGSAEVMLVRGLDYKLTVLLRQCVDLQLVDTYGWIQLAVARYGAIECVEPGVRQLEQYLTGAVAPVAPAHIALIKAVVARRFGRPVDARGRARDAAHRYHELGWRLSEAFAHEAAGDITKARATYELCGASADAARLAASQARKQVRAHFGARLTPRELEVARLVVRKWSNNDIARALAVSVRTVDHHVEAAFSKLGLHARWQLTGKLLEETAER